MSLDIRHLYRPSRAPSRLTSGQVRSSMRNSLFDGAAYSAMLGLTQNYITPYALTMGATTRDIGLLTSVPNFTMAATQFVAPTLSDRAGSRKAFILPMALTHALLWLPILLIPYLFHTHQIWWLIVLVTVSTAFDSALNPVWGSMMADLVPAKMRGRFFGLRNRITAFLSLAFAYAAGGILQLLTGNTNQAFTIIFIAAIASRLVSFYFLSRMYEPLSPGVEKKTHDSVFRISRGLFSTNIGMFIMLCALMNFTTTIAGPFFSPYMLVDLHMSYITYTVINSVAGFAVVGFMTWWGKRIDRAGSIKILKITSLFVPFVAVGWAIYNTLWWLAIMQVFSGFAWAGFQLSSGVFIFDAAPAQNRTRYIALYNSLVFLGVSLGSLTGGLVAPLLPAFIGSYYRSVFLVSGIGRLAVGLFFFRRIREVRRVPQIEAGELLFSDFQRPWRNRAYGYLASHLRRRKVN
jgi:MFS family permease